MTTDLGELRRAAAGLHLPGSPAPLEVFDWTSLTDAEPSDAAVLEHAGFPPGAPVKRQAVDELFRGLGGRFDGLLGVLRKQLRDLRVYRVGGEHPEVLIAGRTDEGSWAGLRALPGA